MRYLILTLACAVILVGCGGQPAPQNPAPSNPSVEQPAPAEPTDEQPATEASGYFPYTPGVKAEYEGKGNEYASYTIEVLYKEGSLVEWRKASGGTTMAEVYRIEPDQVTLVYREGEAYDQEKRLDRPSNIEQIILKGPIEPGTTWQSDNATYTIRSTTETVEAAGQTLTDVVLVEAKYPDSTIRYHYHKTYGMVLSVFESEGAVVESRLKSFTGP